MDAVSPAWGPRVTVSRKVPAGIMPSGATATRRWSSESWTLSGTRSSVTNGRVPNPEPDTVTVPACTSGTAP